ncbi:MAG: DoxX protein [Ginsengibacter sp.]
MKQYQAFTVLFLRISLASGFLSAVASRFGLWGAKSSGWNHFVMYTGEVNSFAPKNWVLSLAVISTISELCLGILLLIGFKTSYTAFAAGILTLLFALAMSFSFGIKEPFDYSVFAVSASSFLLASVQDYPWSIDLFISKLK